MATISMISLLLVYFVLYSMICLSSSIPNKYSILSDHHGEFEKESSRLFQVWKRENGREYSSLEEEVKRYDIFKSNLKYIEKKNAERNSANDYRLGLNQFSDMSYEEFSDIYLQAIEEPVIKDNGGSENELLNEELCEDAPSSLNWIDKGAVTQVKSQAQYACCWAFSTTGAIEGIHKIVTNKLVSLSEQQLVSCSKLDDNNGRKGVHTALQYVMDNRGIAKEEDYPYKAIYGTCDPNLEQKRAVSIDDYKIWEPVQTSESSLLCAVAKQPVSIYVYWSLDMLYYKEGIFDGSKGNCSKFTNCQTNHAMLVVGYDSLNGEDYWIVKNTVGTSWGEKGYIRIKRNTGVDAGVCNINCFASYPIIKRKLATS